MFCLSFFFACSSFFFNAGVLPFYLMTGQRPPTESPLLSSASPMFSAPLPSPQAQIYDMDDEETKQHKPEHTDVPE